MGFARSAELNGYPGPAHVLELAADLVLSPEQVARTEALFVRMRTRAAELGRRLVDEERALERTFASRSVTPQSLEAALARIAGLRAEVRRVHLDAHLEQASLLSEPQIAAYARLRGYDGGAHGGHAHRH